MEADEIIEKHAESIGEHIEHFLAEKEFVWETPRTRDSLNSIRSRFTKKEYELVIKPKLMFR